MDTLSTQRESIKYEVVSMNVQEQEEVLSAEMLSKEMMLIYNDNL